MQPALQPAWVAHPLDSVERGAQHRRVGHLAAVAACHAVFVHVGHGVGLERVVRGGEPIKVHAYDGKVMPLGDKSVDVTIVADVLHHEPEPDRLLRECVRVSRRLVIIKDHRISGPISKARVSLMDWAANAPYGVPCLFRYNTLEQWRAEPGKFGATVEHERTSMDLYPGLWNPVFGKGLQYMAFWRTDKN